MDISFGKKESERPERREPGEGELRAVLLLFLAVTSPIVFVGWGSLNSLLEAQGGLGAGIGSLLSLGAFLFLAGRFSRFLLRFAEASDEARPS